jgi:hypothetical protein
MILPLVTVSTLLILNRADVIGVVISQSIVAFSRRKLVTDSQFLLVLPNEHERFQNLLRKL